MTRNDTKSQVTPKAEVTTAPDKALWIKVAPQSAAQVSGGNVLWGD
jgi:hypothetical protein